MKSIYKDEKTHKIEFINPSLKLEYIPMDEQEYIMKHVKHLPQLVRAMLITCIYNFNSHHISLIFMLILCNYDVCYLNFMNFLHWNVILLKFIFMHKVGITMCFLDD